MDCPICLSCIESGGCETECGHTFHSKCIFEAMQRSVSCPICRAALCEQRKPVHTVEISEITFHERDQQLRRQQRNYDARRRRLERINASVATAKNSAESSYKDFLNKHSEYEELWESAIRTLQQQPDIAKMKHARHLAMRRMRRAGNRYKALVTDTLGERPGAMEVMNETLAEALQRLVLRAAHA